MKVLHIAAHLGGGVGKAHSALVPATDGAVGRHYVLLEPPRDMRFVDAVRAAGAEVTVAPDFATLGAFATEADIVQVEWWNHPRLYECLCRAGLPPLRSVFWCHVSGLYAPFIPPGLYGVADRFLFSSPCSFDAPGVRALEPDVRNRLGVANSGFGFSGSGGVPAPRGSQPAVAYLGTVDFSKMNPQFFDVVEGIDAPDFSVSVWGTCDSNSDVARRAAGLRTPKRVVFEGYARDPEQVLSTPGIFLYLLHPQHFGTAENALVEAMSLGWAPLVFDNPAEAAIVQHEKTGFIETTSEAVRRRLQWMLDNPEAVASIGANAAADVAARRTPELTAKIFDETYRLLLANPKRPADFRSVLGETPSDWFLTTLSPNAGGEDIPPFAMSGAASKGSFRHFAASFPDDASLRALADRVTGS